MEQSKRGSNSVQDVESAVRSVVGRVLGVKDPDYDDLVQSAIEQVLLTFERRQFRGDCPKVGWAAVIARNVAINGLRARSRERRLFSCESIEVEGAGGLDTKLGPEQLMGVQEQLRRVKNALIGLGVRQANVVFLHDVLGHELGDVASILRITEAAAQSRLVRGRRQIIDEIERTRGPVKEVPQAGRGGRKARGGTAIAKRVRTQPQAKETVSLTLDRGEPRPLEGVLSVGCAHSFAPQR